MGPKQTVALTHVALGLWGPPIGWSLPNAQGWDELSWELGISLSPETVSTVSPHIPPMSQVSNHISPRPPTLPSPTLTLYSPLSHTASLHVSPTLSPHLHLAAP